MTRNKKLTVDPPTSQEEAKWMLSVQEETTRLQVEYMKASMNLNQPVCVAFKPVHLHALSEIARATYIGRVSERRAELKDRPPEETAQLDMWLI